MSSESRDLGAAGRRVGTGCYGCLAQTLLLGRKEMLQLCRRYGYLQFMAHIMEEYAIYGYRKQWISRAGNLLYVKYPYVGFTFWMRYVLDLALLSLFAHGIMDINMCSTCGLCVLASTGT
ncbi:hypothetical protein XENTR_v10004053 [Xenopus tropicalis]|nr:hypothetical protein XENTR_v10004053 [Xenopus tropicalis]